MELEFFYDESGAPYAFSYKANASATPVMYYYVTNLQGDVTNIVDASGNVVASYSYNAWGKVLTATGSMAAINPIRYRGYYYDSDTELYYLLSRYYDPEICRFLNADNQLVTDELTGINLFAYCGNNPVSREDTSGDIWVTVGVMAIGGLIGAAIGAVSSAITQQALTGTVNWKSVGVAAATGFVSGAVAASPLKIVGQQIVGGVVGSLAYAVDCHVNNKAIKLDEAILSMGMGVVSGRIGGPGANENMLLSNTVKSVKQTIARETRRANQKYAQKSITAAVSSFKNTFSSTAWAASFRFAAGSGISNGVTGKYTTLGLFPDAPAWKP